MFRVSNAESKVGQFLDRARINKQRNSILAYLKLSVGPARDLHDHVEDGLLLVGIQGDVMEGRDRHAILLDVDAVLERVRGRDLADGVRGRHDVLRGVSPSRSRIAVGPGLLLGLEVP